MKLTSIFNYRIVFLIPILTFYIIRVNADTVYLKDGNIISGKIISFSEGLCVFNTKYGSVIKLGTNEIINLATDDEYEISFTSGERITGKLYLDTSNNTVLESNTFGKIVIDINNITSLVRFFDQNESQANIQNREQSFGEKEESPPLDFLTNSTVLLSPGAYEIEIGSSYQQSRQENSLMNVGYFQRSAYTAKKFELALTGRFGIYDRLESWVTIPFTYIYIENVSTNEFVRDADSYDMGDISCGFQYLIYKESSRFPAISSSISINGPTGNMDYRNVVDKWQDPFNNGSGHLGISFGLSFVRTLDPAILFGGVAYQHEFTRNIDGYDVNPGWGINSYFGLGFALNEKLSLGSRVGWMYSSTMTVDGTKIYGSDNEPMDLSFSVSYRFIENWVATPSVSFSLNKDAGTQVISLKLVRRF